MTLFVQSILSEMMQLISVISSLVVELFIHRNHKNPAFNSLILHKNILTTVHAMTKPFVPFCSAQDSESADINC